MSNIMRAPTPKHNITIPLNGRALQNFDCIAIICPEVPAQNALLVYQAGNWTPIGCDEYTYTTSENVLVIYTGSINTYYACFLPSPTSG